MTTKSFLLRLPDDFHKQLRKIAFEEERSINEILNELVKKYLEAHNKKLPAKE